MSYYVLDCRVYFSDEGNAENAFNHIKALAEHSAAHDVHVGAETESSWGRLHDCKADENDGDTSQCETIELFTIGASDPGEPGDAPEWEPGQNVSVGDLRTYQEVEYSCLQAHTTQVGWEPPNTPALWQVT